MAKKVCWGIIGCGGIAGKFAADLRLVDDAVLYGVASRSLSKAKAFADDYGASEYYDNYEALLACPEVDAIYIATPHTFHYAHTMMSLDAGKHVLCEKPMGINHRQVAAMIDKAKTNGLLLMEAMWTHFLPAIIDAKAAIARGVIGEVLHMRSDFGFAAHLDPSGRLLNPSLGGGALLDIGIYPAYIMLELLGEPEQISAHSTMSATCVDLHTSVLATFSGGRQAYLESTFRAVTTCTTTVYGTDGHLVINSRWHDADSYTIVKNSNTETITLPKHGLGYSHETMAFVAALQGSSRETLYSHKSSQRLIRFLDSVRAEIGLVYPDEV